MLEVLAAMTRRRWLAGLAPLLAAMTIDARITSSAERKTGGHGGLLVKLGPYTGEVLFWENSVELFLLDSKGGDVPLAAVGVRAKLARNDRKAPIEVRFQPGGDRLRANVDLVGARSIEAVLELELENRKRHRARVVWRIEDDRGRLDDSE
jgi:hypothetical protein